VRNVNQFVQKDLVSSVHASISLIFTEVLVFALQSVVVLDALSLAVDSILERSMSLDFRQLLFVVDVARCPILKHIDVILNVSRGLHF